MLKARGMKHSFSPSAASRALLAISLLLLACQLVSAAEVIREVGHYDTPGRAHGVAVAGSYAYVADWKSGLRIVDISNPQSPHGEGHYDTPGRARGVAVGGSYAYVADGNSGLRIIDVSNPQSPSEAGAYHTPGRAYGVAVAGSYAYVADAWAGLRVISVADPAHPVEIGSCDTPGDAIGVAVAGSYAYVADGYLGLRVIDVSVPAAPHETGHCDTPGAAYGVAVAGSYAYVADGNSGLRIINITNPQSPSEAGYYDTPRDAFDVAIAGSYAYVADGNSGLRIINITNPQSPSEAGYYDTPRDAFDVAIAGSHAYVADRKAGLRIIATPELRESPAGTPQVAQPQGLPPVLDVGSLSYSDAGNQDGVLDGDERGQIVLSVRNRGKGDAQGLVVYVAPAENVGHVKYQAETKVPMVKKGDSVTVRIPISADEQVETQTVKLRIDVKEPYFGADADAKVISFSTRRLAPPDLFIAQTGVDDDEEGQSMGNSNGTIEPGETFEMTAIVQNKGTGRADDVRVSFLEPSDKNVMFVGTSDTALGSIEPGDWKKVVVPVYVNKRIEKQSFGLPLTIAERRPRFSRTDTISLSLNKQMKRPDEIAVTKVVTEEKVEQKEVPDLTADVDRGIPETGEKNPRAVAVIVAGQDYQQAPKVDYAARDAAVLKRYLTKALGFREENIILLRNPGKADFERVFGIKGKPQGQLYNYVRKGESDVFVYYAGHGAPDLKTKEAYLVPTDAQPSYIDLQGYPLSTLYENLAQIPAKSMTVVLDACFSGAYDKGMIIEQASPLPVAAVMEQPVGSMNVATACGAGEVASWYSDKRHSLFTYWFLKGLQGEADENKDKSITVGELRKYVSDNVSYWAQRLYNRIQTPTFSGDDARVVAKLK
jgi:hypothetical protein